MAKRSLFISLLIFIVLLPLVFIILLNLTYGNAKKVPIIPSDNNVRIGWNGVSVPLEYITLVRKENYYGAVKLTNFWTMERKYLIGSGKFDDILINYESYYQGNGTGDFVNKNVIIRKGEASNKIRLRRIIVLHPLPIGNPMVRCGPFEIWWTSGSSSINWLNFNFEMLYGPYRSKQQSKIDFELAPTKWTDISKVNVFDPRVKWYKPYEVKNVIEIPIDKLWEEKEPKQEPKGKDSLKSK